MTYCDHLITLIHAATSAMPGQSPSRLSRGAGLNPTWAHSVIRQGSFNSAKADALIAHIREICPTGAPGDGVRALLARLDTLAASGESERSAA